MAITPQVVGRRFGGNNNPDINWFDLAASAAIVTGNFVAATNGVLDNAASSTTGAIVGLANFTYTNGASATTGFQYPVVEAKDTVIRMNFYNGGAKTTFTQADLYDTAYGFYNATTLDPNDTTNGVLKVVGYNNTNLTVDVVVIDSALYLV